MAAASVVSKNFSIPINLGSSPDEILLPVNGFSVSFWSIDMTLPPTRPITYHTVSSIAPRTIDLTKMFGSKVPATDKVPCTEIVVRAPFKAGDVIGIGKKGFIEKSNETTYHSPMSTQERWHYRLSSRSGLSNFSFPKDKTEVVEDFVFFTYEKGEESIKDGRRCTKILGIKKIEMLVCKFISTAQNTISTTAQGTESTDKKADK